MAYQSEDFFRDYSIAKQAGIALCSVVARARVENAWELYKNARQPDLGFHIFGRHKHDQYDNMPPAQVPAQLNPQDVGIRNAELANFGKLNDQTKGSALKISNNIWSFIINDAWLLGGTHSYLPFYAASPVSVANVYSAQHILSITGRELVGLALCGYKEVGAHADLGKAYICQDKAKADSVTLLSYLEKVVSLKKRSDAEDFFASAGFNI